ncbi:MAG TPA: nicotinamide mononucleotide transporter family protein [Stackebrandtia sp.]|uniref:nicotinamide mononucleotide transporter family protein n=1 Tax=Stackebrandtia sp. TaxID=2023065 RepID=UPI002D368303|nr:nicotinamide mononucleotide transporter family protein [Stackebrandtia sp.]HZE39924.1 nicotinamide mononucleotide transporter family protein [Stackebrandtia sp.]
MDSLVESGLTIAGQHVSWAELFGQIAAVTVVLLAAKRTLWVWPVQILATVLLFVVYTDAHLGGLRDRQVAILLISLYGWWVWWRHRRDVFGMPVRRATRGEWFLVTGAMVLGTVGYALYLTWAGGSWSPWPDAWIFIGTVVAFAAQGRGLVEFWFVWLAVDAVAVPLQLASGLWFSALIYVVFAVLVIRGYVAWSRSARKLEALAGQGTP